MMTGRDHQNDTAASRQGAGAHTPSTARFALLLFPLLLLLTAGLFVFTAYAASTTGTVVFGPKTFSPGVHFRFFRVPEPTGPYTLRVVNGDPPTGQKRVTSALITLNNAIVVRARDFTASTASVEKPVTLRKLNLLTVTVVGKTGSHITLSIQSQGNTKPVANAGPDQTVFVRDLVTLDGSGSSDVDGDPLSFLWSFMATPTGSSATLSDPTAVKPTFVIDQAGNYVARLVVNDGTVNSAPDTATISTQNSAPVANAGTDQTTVTTVTTVTLDGNGSSDVDGDALTYAWSFTSRPDGSVATLSDPKAVNPTFTVDKAGVYLVQLVVNDGKVNSAPATVAISTVNSAPVANAGTDQTTVTTVTTVTLDGSGSTDVDGDMLTYAWSLTKRPVGSVAELSGPTAVKPTFTVDKVGDYVVQLIVSDGELYSAPVTVTISTVNSPPVAHAGPDQTVFVGDLVNLDGSASSDVDGDALTFAWSLTSQPAGSMAALSDTAAVKPTFTLDKAGDYVVQLVVNDGKESSVADTVTITTRNSAPVAHAGTDQSVTTGIMVTLDGRGSKDVDEDPLSFLWSFTARPAGSAAALSNSAAVKPTFTVDRAGDYVAQLIVNDGTVYSDPDTVLIQVATANQPPEITSDPATTTATAGQIYQYDVEATDPDAGDTLTYSLLTKPDGMTIDAASGQIRWTPAESQVGDHSVQVRVTDLGGLFDEQDFVVTVSPTNQAPQVGAGDDQAITLPANSVALNGTVSDDGRPNPPGAVTVTWTKDSGPGDVTFVNANAEDTTATFPGAGTYVLRLTASDGDQSASDTVTITVNAEPQIPLPPDPATVAPPIDPTVVTTVHAATEFLYTGANPIQTGVAPGTIEPKRAAVVRGKVLDRDGNPLSGVTITFLNHPEFGQTLSRADGMFDMAVNGGGLLTVNYQKTGYLPAQRQINVPWQDYAVVEDVLLVPRDSRVTLINLTDATTMQVAQGSVVSDSDGSRQATLLVAPGTQASKLLPDGSTQPLDTLSLRFTEYTVGAQGPKAMPAKLPPASGYTYAVEISADEAGTKINGKDVLFSQPVPFYVENFLNFPVGGEGAGRLLR